MEGTQVGGDHYKKLGMEPRVYIEANHMEFSEGNVVKYISRYKDKKGYEDLIKCVHNALFVMEREYALNSNITDRIIKELKTHSAYVENK